MFFAESTFAALRALPRHRAFALPVAALCLLLATAACTRPPEEDRNSIRFSIWGSIEQQRAEEQMLREFAGEHPDIRVDLRVIGSRYAEVMQAMFVGNVAPDVVMVPLSQYDEWASRGGLKMTWELPGPDRGLCLTIDEYYYENSHII